MIDLKEFMQTRAIWTIGHSTRSWEEFLLLLQAFEIQVLTDVRLLPGSRRYPHFNQENLQQSLAAAGMEYVHAKALGGRRKSLPGSINTAWRNAAFRGYADHMQTGEFSTAVAELEKRAQLQRTVYMCSEAVWWSCHRALLSDYLKWKGWSVWHIMSKDKVTEHPYTKPARIVNGVLRYDMPDLFS